MAYKPKGIILTMPSNSIEAHQQRIEQLFKSNANQLHLPVSVSFDGWFLYIDDMKIGDIRQIYDIGIDKTATPSICFKMNGSDCLYLLDYGIPFFSELDWYDRLAGLFKLDQKAKSCSYIER